LSEHDNRLPPDADADADAGPGPDAVPLHWVDAIPVRAHFLSETIGGRWAVTQWRLAAVEPADPQAPGALPLEVFVDEAEGYYLNLTSGEPSIMVRWRLPEDISGTIGEAGDPVPMAVTLSYNEAGRWMDGGERVDRVPMPAEMVEWLAEFVKLHWKPEEKPRKRRGPKPSFMRRDEFAQLVDRERQGFSPGPGGEGSGNG
jgi:hypothetical protein